MEKYSNLITKIDQYYDTCLFKCAYIKQVSNKWKVLSQKGKSLGTYDTKEEAVKRLRQVEYFKHKDNFNIDDNSVEEKIIDLTDVDDFSYSAIMRKMRQEASKEQVKDFLKFFKVYFDKAVKDKLPKPEKVSLQNSLIKFNKIHKIKINKKLVKIATTAELGAPAQVGLYLANICRFILNRIEPDKRAKAMETLRNKFYYTNSNELSQKTSPPSAAVGQSITFVKHVLFNQQPEYIREVLNHLSANLY